MTYDPITLQILWSRLISVVDEAAAALVRTSFSTVLRESNDFACVLLDAQGNALAQSSLSIPSFIRTLPRTVRHFLDYFPPSTLRPGDVLLTNDPWLGTGHLPDITIAKPIFRGDRLVAFTGSSGHLPDIYAGPQHGVSHQDNIRTRLNGRRPPHHHRGQAEDGKQRNLP